MTDIETALVRLRAGALFDLHKLSLEDSKWTFPVGDGELTLTAGAAYDESDPTRVSRKYAMLISVYLKRGEKAYTAHKYLSGPLPELPVPSEYRAVVVDLVEWIIKQETP